MVPINVELIKKTVSNVPPFTRAFQQTCLSTNVPFNLCGGAARYARGADPRLATVKFFVSVDPVTPGVGEAVQKEALLYDDMVLIHHETEAGGPVHFTQQQHVFSRST